MSMDTPVLLIVWRRPHTLRQVIDAIRPVAPTHLFVACDGPNPERLGEAEKVASTRALIERQIDWPCQIERFYSDENQGCRLGVSRAITWFFEQVEEGIILEDDCVPHPDLFYYCTTLLEHYRYDTRVWCISGNNFQNRKWRGDGSYYFGSIPLIWGWASWRRCWQHYDAELTQWPSLRDSGLLESMFKDPLERKYWSRIWQRLWDQGMPDTWDYQWTFTCLANGALTAIPNRNLVSNVGFGVDATHTKGGAINTAISEGVDPNQRPSFLLRNGAADRYTFDHHFGGKWRRLPLSLFWLPRRVAGVIERKLKKFFDKSR
jgi:hypothetical protein